MKKLILPTLRYILIGFVAFGIVLFVPAWTLNYWQAWVFILVFTACANGIGVYLSIKDPVLLERRKQFGPAAEQSPAQKVIMSLTLLGVLALLVFSALDHRFGWSQVPAVVSLVGNGLVALGFMIDLLTFKENSFGGSSIRTEAGQNVISTGPYALVRHPMYAGVLVMVCGVPPALGSWWGLAVLAWRILDEEKLLRKDLPGYADYTQKVHYRLVPYLW